jgi:hypothetical protein
VPVPSLLKADFSATVPNRPQLAQFAPECFFHGSVRVSLEVRFNVYLLVLLHRDFPSSFLKDGREG